MIKVTVMYPNGDNARFDFEYYTGRHLPDAQKLLGDACRKIEVDQGLAGGAPGEPPTYIAISHLYFDSVEAFQAAFGPHAATIMADVPNFTNTAPALQISQLRS